MKKLLFTICCVLVGTFAWGVGPLQVQPGFNYYLVDAEVEEALTSIEGVRFFSVVSESGENQMMEAPQVLHAQITGLIRHTTDFHVHLYNASSLRHAKARRVLATPALADLQNHANQFYIIEPGVQVAVVVGQRPDGKMIICPIQ